VIASQGIFIWSLVKLSACHGLQNQLKPIWSNIAPEWISADYLNQIDPMLTAVPNY
jgi:hypothetical protein